MKVETHAVLDRLRLAVHGLTSPFSCDGTFAPRESVALVFKDQTRFQVARAQNVMEQEGALKPLLQRCGPAPFGEGKKTRYDRRVRDAYQLKAADGGFTVLNFDPEAAGILEMIQRGLVPRDSKPISAELYTVNIYTRGGHFARHKDTPRGGDMFGTLVVCLPARFFGGALILSHHGIVRKFDWGSAIHTDQEQDKTHWAAFFGDVDHEIDSVSMGARVTLTYLLRHGKGGEPSRDGMQEDMEPHVQAAWQALLADKRFLPDGGTLAYPCCHLYHQDARLQQEQSPTSAEFMTTLKGRDQLVAATAMAAGLQVTFNPYMFENCADETWQLDRFPTRKEQSRLRKRMDEQGLKSTLPIRASSESEGDFGLIWLDPRPSYDATRRRSTTDDNREFAAVGHLHSCEYSPWGYFGNEGSDIDLYVYAALHVGIPALGEGPRPPKKPSKRAPARGARGTRRTQ